MGVGFMVQLDLTSRSFRMLHNATCSAVCFSFFVETHREKGVAGSEVCLQDGYFLSAVPE